ncbi:hypothetical protein ABZ848_46200 [Streptomyces sp. NPDC047081]|uniref:DinB/UmuC family translesion DNA polymerase n=1 Tax=Streptomyces sp. NPDC047081 TaxID=3154706 RepID=UPI00340AD77D
MVRAALLALVVQLGTRLRRRGQVARAVTLSLRFAGGALWEKTRRLPEASARDDDLRLLAYQVDGRGRPSARTPDRSHPQGGGPHRRRPGGTADQPRHHPGGSRGRRGGRRPRPRQVRPGLIGPAAVYRRTS